jgi:signal recognition particle subunit SRP54
MTPEERRDPSILNASRRKRIAQGCGLPVSQINSLIKRYDEAKKIMKQYARPGKKGKRAMFKGFGL